jgi:23S rRNA pseudouridine1911/1915/1917 synthase
MSDVYKKFTPELYEAVYQVEEAQTGLRLDQYCAIYLPSFSRQQIKKKIKDGDIKIFDRPYPHKPSVKVYHREKIQIKTYRGNLEDEFWNGKKIDLQLDPDIIFEDENIISISKPAYMATHPTGKHLFNCATVYFENKLNQTIYSIHRLDRETSGILLLAKKVTAAQKCTELFEKDLVKKCYLFIAHKKKDLSFPITVNERLGIIEDSIPRIYNHCFPKDSQKGKHAETLFIDLFQNEHYVIGLAFPKTGRQHQIRSHAAFHGFPLVGDKLYNGDPTVFMRFKDLLATKEDHELMQLPRHALHAIAQKIPFPSTDNPSLFQAPIPHDFQQWLNKEFSHITNEQLQNKIHDGLKGYFHD